MGSVSRSQLQQWVLATSVAWSVGVAASAVRGQEAAPSPPPTAADAATPVPAPTPGPTVAEESPPAPASAPEPERVPAQPPNALPEPIVEPATQGPALEPAARPEAEPEEAMVVTGSRIRRSPELATSAPVEIIDRKQLERTGAANAGDIVRNLTAAQGSGFQGGGNPQNQGGGARGAVTVNLRGLGAGSTLVLINGRRMVPAGGGGTESLGDIGIIPLSAIERIEVLKGGGTAIYGADAVGGVINIITRSAWEGARVEVQAQATSRLDQGDFTVSGAFGAKTERSRVLLALNHMRRTELTSDKRPFSNAANVDQNGNPATFIAPGLDASMPMRTRFVDPACSRVPGSKVVPTIINGEPTGDETCSFSTARFGALLGNLERSTALGTGSYDITDHTSLFAELQVSRMRTDGVFPASFSVPPPLLIVPADHVDNPFGRAVGFLGRPLGAASGAKRGGASDDTLRAVAGLRGDFGGVGAESVFEDWEWEVSASWGISRFSLMSSDSLREPLRTALNSCSNPRDLSRCFNPFFSAIDGTGTPNSSAVIDSFTGTQVSLSDYSMQTYNVGLTGSLFALPGGDFSMAVGGELRREWRATRYDHDSNEQRYAFLLGNANARADRSVASGYAELRWPLFRGVEVQTAARIEHYTDIDETTPSPFAGLVLVPGVIALGDEVAPIWKKLQLTAQVTSAFRAPALYQSFPGFNVQPTALTVPNSPTPVFLPVQAFGNPDLEPERALIVSAGLNWQPIEALTLNAEFWNYDYRSRITLESAGQAVANDVMSMAMGGEGDPRVLHDPMTGAIQSIQVKQRNIDGHIVTNGIDVRVMASLSGETFGGDRNDWGSVSLGTEGTLTLNYDIPRALAAPRTIPNVRPAQSLPPLHCDGESCEAVGSRNFSNIAPPLPRWRFNFPVFWSLGAHSAGLIAHFTSGLENDNAVSPDGSLGQMSSQMTFDLQYGLTIRNWFGEELGLRVGLYNVFDTFPPITKDANGYETLLYDPRGRMLYATLNSSF